MKKSMSTIALLAGARPNYMKIFPVWREIKRTARDRMRPVIIHTGQHYDPLMNDIFFREFGMPTPDHFLGIGSGTHGAQTGRAMIALEELFVKDRPDALVVVGDVNSTAAGTLVAAKMGIPVAHVEAGLRSRDRTMPEEINRLVTDAIADLLLTPSRDADANLRAEGIPAEKIRFTGNVMIDSLVELLPRAGQSPILDTLGVKPGHYVAVTLHRPSNVDHPETLARILDALEDVTREMPVIFPVHPRTQKQIETSGRAIDRFATRIIPPLGYLDFLRLQSAASVVVTDSGGVQEETTYLGIPCLTLRPNTERPVTITHGTNRLVDPAAESLSSAVRSAIAGKPARAPVIEGWDGRAAGRIVHELETLLR